MNIDLVEQLAQAFYQEMQVSGELQRHMEEHRRRNRRAGELLTKEQIPSLDEEKIRELFFDSDSFSFWKNKDWEFNNRLQSVGLDGLRNVLLELIARGENGLTPDDLKHVWELKGLGTLLSTELLAYRFPDRYWTYSSNVTLPALMQIGEDVKAAMPHGHKSDAYLYIALEPHLVQIRGALEHAGFVGVDNLLVDLFLYWIKDTKPQAAVVLPGIPEVNTAAIEQAMHDFDTGKRDRGEWLDWESNHQHRYAILWQERNYPVKEIVRMATGATNFVSTQARAYLQAHGFTIIPLRSEQQAAEEWDENGQWLEDTEPAAPVDVGATLTRFFAASGLQFTSWQIATFYTALQTKGFVILSGISGTGKTKLAQAFAAMLPQPVQREATPTDDVITLTIQPYMLKYGRLIIPKSATRLFDPPLAGQYQEVCLQFAHKSQMCRLVHAVYGNSDYLSLLLRGSVRPWFTETFAEGSTIILQPELDKNDTLSGFHIGTPSDISPGSPVKTESRQSNLLFVPVRPDWRDSKSLLGYYNPLTGTYEWTPFLRFLLRAAQSYRDGDGLAWFVILDEMNLAHVEYYFADLLSVLESGRHADSWTHEPLRLLYPDEAEGNLPPRELRLPPNLYIVGTVNADETTHAFSPKVLDRAFTLELTEADFSVYPPLQGQESIELNENERRSILDNFTSGGRFARIDKQQILGYVDSYPGIRSRLQNLNNLLRPYELHFGYRVFDEIVSFLSAAGQNGLYEELGGVDAAFDAAVLMKVLPKFHGSRAKLEGPLRAVLAWCIDPESPAEEAIEDALQDIETSVSISRWKFACLNSI